MDNQKKKEANRLKSTNVFIDETHEASLSSSLIATKRPSNVIARFDLPPKNFQGNYQDQIVDAASPSHTALIQHPLPPPPVRYSPLPPPLPPPQYSPYQEYIPQLQLFPTHT